MEIPKRKKRKKEKNNYEKLYEVRIHAKIGSIPDLFGRFIGDIPELVRGYIRYGQG